MTYLIRPIIVRNSFRRRNSVVRHEYSELVSGLCLTLQFRPRFLLDYQLVSSVSMGLGLLAGLETSTVALTVTALDEALVCAYLVKRAVPVGRQFPREISTAAKHIRDTLALFARKIAHNVAVPIWSQSQILCKRKIVY